MNILDHDAQMINRNYSNINLITIIIKLKQGRIEVRVRRKDALSRSMERNQNALLTLYLKKKKVLVFK